MADGEPVLDQINLVVRDMDAVVEFYEQLGLTSETTGAAWERHHRTLSSPHGLDFDIDSTESAVGWNGGWPLGETGAVIGFRFDSRGAVDEKYGELTAAGYVGQQPPYDAFWGARYAVVADPEGNAVGLMSPMDPAFRAPPPPPLA